MRRPRRLPLVNHDREGYRPGGRAPSRTGALWVDTRQLRRKSTALEAATEVRMALKVELKPHERIIIGSCVITNTDQRARLLIDGDNVPILREKEILNPEMADTA